jgi:hypothetical protein
VPVPMAATARRLKSKTRRLADRLVRWTVRPVRPRPTQSCLRPSWRELEASRVGAQSIVHVPVPTQGQQSGAAPRALTADQHTTDESWVRALRAVHSRPTSRRRVTEMTQRVGLAPADESDPLVSIVVVSNRPAFAEHMLANVRRQVYPRCELIVTAHGWDDADLADLKARLAEVRDARLITAPASATLGGCMNDAIDESRGDFFAKFDDDDFYAPDYLADAMLAFRYTDAAVVGKRTFFAYVDSTASTYVRFPGYEFRYVNRIFGATMVCDRRVVRHVRFMPLRDSGEDSRFLADCVQKHLPIFSTDKFNFAHFRRGPEHRHTWQIQDEKFLETCEHFRDGFSEELVRA